MKLLFVYDSRIKRRNIDCLLRDKNITSVDLFPLIEDSTITKDVKGAISSQGIKSVSLINTAETIDEHVDCLREGICRWSAEIGETLVKGKRVKQWFLLPGESLSTWWLSLISEKNNFKTNAFFQVVQVHALQETLNNGKYELCAIAIKDRDLTKSIKNVVRKLNMRAKILPVVFSENLRGKVKRILRFLGLFGDFIHGCFVLVTIFMRGCRIRQHLGSRSKRLPKSQSLLFVSYFPAVDKGASQKGVFRNKYALPLQDRLMEMGIPILWLLMCVPLDGHSFNDAVRLAGVFAKRGEKLLVLEEFLTIKDAIMSFLMLFRQSILSFFIFDTVKEKSLLSAPIGDSCGPIIKSLWNRSFCGDIGIMGILYYFIFKQVFKEVLNINDCLYYCEMHAWEKALNAAKKQVNPNIRTIGFQHATASRNFYHFFYDPKETMVKREISTLPLPNVIACNGDIMYSNSAESGYQNLVKVEAVRQVYLDEILSSPRKSRKGKPVLLVAGSIDKTESTNLITLVSAAFPKMEGFDIRFKGHPSMPFEKLFEEEGVDVSKRGYLICNNNISECLESAWAVLVPTSTVSIEALLYGCEVIIPALPNSMLMSPLADFKGYYHKVTYPEELKETMCKIVNGYTLHSISEYKEFVRNYWCIDRTLPRWTKLLKSNAYYD